MKLTGKLEKAPAKDLDKVQISAAHNKIPRVWVVTADKRIARIFKKNGAHFELLGEAFPGQETSGRAMGGAGGFGEKTAHHKYAPDKDPSQLAEAAFVQKLAGWLDQAVRDDAFDRLVIAAAPHTLGDLRKSLSKQVQLRVTAEINKDLTKHDAAALRQDLADIVQI